MSCEFPLDAGNVAAQSLLPGLEAVMAIPHVLQLGVYGGQAGFHLIKLNGNGADRVQNGLQHFTIIHGILPPSDIQYNRESLGCQGTAKGSGADFRLMRI